jgi:hypothetical protein
MFISIPKIKITKAVCVLAAAVFAVLAFAGVGSVGQRARASATGPSPAFTAAPIQNECPSCPRENNCTACHTGSQPNSGQGSVAIAGLPANYLPDQQIQLTVTTTDPNAVIYGFQMVAVNRNGENAGTLTVPPANPQPLQIVPGFVNGNERRYIEHTVDGVTPTQFGSKSWTFTWTAPSERIGKIGFYAAGNGADSNGASSGDNIYLSSKAALSGTAIANFDADTRSDISVYRPSNGTWYVLTTAPPNYVVTEFGAPGDKPAPGDYDGDGKTDQAVFRPSTGEWHIKRSTGTYTVTTFGMLGDIPVPGDYDGDGKNDLAVWRPSDQNWYYQGSTGIYRFRKFGAATDKPAQGDYDADGKTDIAVFRPSDGTWHILTSKNPNYLVHSFGVTGDMPVQADYDGDGKTDISVFRPSNGTWYRQTATEGYRFYAFGQAGDRPAPADFDGDGITDIAVFRSGTWYVHGSLGPTYTVTSFGEAGDIPVASGYIAE